MKNNASIYIISGILSVALLGYLLFNLDWNTLKTAYAEIHWGWLGMALSAYLVNITLRALRFKNLIYSRPTRWLDLVPVSALHNILMYLMPAKTGDVSYIFIVKDRLGISIAEGSATLLAARLYDFVIVASFLAFILPFAESEMPVWIYQSSVVFCLVVLLGAVAVFTFLRFRKPPKISDKKPSAEKRNLLTRLVTTWDRFLAGLQEIQANGAHLKTAVLTAGIWACVYLNFYSATQSMGLSIPLYHIVIISIVMIPLTLLPLQGFANIGTHEIGWTSVLVAFNYPYATALAVAAGSHFVLLISVLVSGGIAFFGARTIQSLTART